MNSLNNVNVPNGMLLGMKFRARLPILNFKYANDSISNTTVLNQVHKDLYKY